jgi:hypothetical protein
VVIWYAGSGSIGGAGLLSVVGSVSLIGLPWVLILLSAVLSHSPPDDATFAPTEETSGDVAYAPV